MNVAVFGANGYVGQHIVHYLGAHKQHQITGFGLEERYIGPHHIAYRKLDIGERSQFEEVAMDFDFIYMFSALTGTEVAFDRYPDFVRVNELGLLNLLDWVRRADKKAKVIFPSTRLVYKGKEDTTLDEDAEKEFKSIYAATKYISEQYLWMYRNLYGVDYCVFRVSVPYGNELSTRMSYGTLSFFIQQVLEGKPITLYGDGSLRRTFTHIMDVCRQMIEGGEMAASSGEVYNVDGEDFSLREVAEVVVKKYGGSMTDIGWPGNSLALESGHTVFNCDKIRRLLPQPLEHSLKAWMGSQELTAAKTGSVTE